MKMRNKQAEQNAAKLRHKEKLKANAANYRVRLKKLQSDLKLKMLQ